MSTPLWTHCIERLESELTDQELNTWIRPLQIVEQGNDVRILAPNRFVLQWVKQNYAKRISEQLEQASQGQAQVQFEIGTQAATRKPAVIVRTSAPEPQAPPRPPVAVDEEQVEHLSHVNPSFTFETFVEGKSNQLGRAAGMQVASNPGQAYNPFFLYGATGLGKTHLMHAIGNGIVAQKPHAKVLYLHAERYVREMVKALQTNTINEFKRYYHSVDALLIDDIQFFAGKERSQEEFFHTFNALFEGKQQIIMTCDRYPKEVNGLEDRLKSRFGWGLVAAIEPPELETRVAILHAKAEQSGVNLPSEVAFLIAKRVASNVRELEGALRRVVANSVFFNRAITLESAKEALRDLFSVQDKLVNIENIQRTVAEYYKVKFSDILGKTRSRSIARPRQIAMALAKELTTHSLPEIGNDFGHRDHTTVLHATRKVQSLRESDEKLNKDYQTLLRLLTT